MLVGCVCVLVILAKNKTRQHFCFVPCFVPNFFVSFLVSSPVISQQNRMCVHFVSRAILLQQWQLKFEKKPACNSKHKR